MQPTATGGQTIGQPESRAGNAEAGRRLHRGRRNGTRSCWECKRRKIRCTFLEPLDLACASCKHRSIKCVGQDSPNEAPVRSGFPVGARLARVEAVVQQLSTKLGQETTFRSLETDQTESLMRDDSSRPVACRQRRDKLVCSPVPEQTTQSPEPSPPRPPNVGPPPLQHRYDQISQALREAWPSQRDLDIILSIPVSTSRLYHGLICVPYHEFISASIPSAYELLQLPTPSSHPILMARRLLLLSIYLQSLPSSHSALQSLSVPYRDLMAQSFEAAVSLVLESDGLTFSLEGVECIMMQSMYHNNAGNLRRAWLILRRGLGIAQLMGLHKLGQRTSSQLSSGVLRSPELIMIDPVETRLRIDPTQMWFRLIASDRYLSLMLGLPECATDEDHFATKAELEACKETERMERLLVAAGGRILRRNRSRLSASANEDSVMTQGIDQMLHDAAASMPPKWWLMPSVVPYRQLIPKALNDRDAEDESRTNNQITQDIATELQMMNQMTYHYLLIRLHLPYLMRSSSNGDINHSKGTALSSSRELHTRYVHFRLSISPQAASASSTGKALIPPYCRGIDFHAFIASTVICVAMIDSRHQDTHLIFHQRLSDRGLMEHTLEIMEQMAQSDDDPIGAKVASILRPLLAIESEVAKGASYKFNLVSNSSASIGELECGGHVTDSGNLHIYVPYLGVIEIKRVNLDNPIHQKPNAGMRFDEPMRFGEPQENHGVFNPLVTEQQVVDVDSLMLQGVDVAFFNDLMYGMIDGNEEL
ncbi:hypothetical protein GGR57DRAFT_366119 [Xylariaceae sp. FL1272]|nr:hypothetical protein GGR57DRAFT_366119 [Xylariaceae sp. FL1272]